MHMSLSLSCTPTQSPPPKGRSGDLSSARKGVKRERDVEMQTPSPAPNSRRHSFISPSLEPSPPNQKFSQRENGGEVVACFNSEIATASTGDEYISNGDKRVELEILKEWRSSATAPFRYMFEDMDETREGASCYSYESIGFVRRVFSGIMRRVFSGIMHTHLSATCTNAALTLE